MPNGYTPKVYKKQGGNELVVASGGKITLESGAIFARPAGSALALGFIPLPLAAWRLVASNDVPAIAVASGNGGNLAVDTAPKLKRVNAATDKQLRLEWAASSSIEIFQQFLYPPDLDDTADVTLNIRAAMAGATDIPTLGIGAFEGVGDTDFGGNTAAVTGVTPAVYPRTLAAADIGAYPKATTLAIIPAAHTTDALYIYETYLTYTKKQTA